MQRYLKNYNKTQHERMYTLPLRWHMTLATLAGSASRCDLHAELINTIRKRELERRCGNRPALRDLEAAWSTLSGSSRFRREFSAGDVQTWLKSQNFACE